MPNFNHRPLYCVADGDHVHTLNKDLDNLAQKSADDDYKVSVGSNFRIPEKPSNKSNHIIIEHTDEMLEVLREQAGTKEDDTEPESKLIYMINKTDNLEKNRMATLRRRLPSQQQVQHREAELGEPNGEQLHLHHQEPTTDRLGY